MQGTLYTQHRQRLGPWAAVSKVDEALAPCIQPPWHSDRPSVPGAACICVAVLAELSFIPPTE